MAAEDINAIWEACKDMGLLLGKGGLYSHVSSTIGLNHSHEFIITLHVIY